MALAFSSELVRQCSVSDFLLSDRRRRGLGIGAGGLILV